MTAARVTRPWGGLVAMLFVVALVLAVFQVARMRGAYCLGSPKKLIKTVGSVPPGRDDQYVGVRRETHWFSYTCVLYDAEKSESPPVLYEYRYLSVIEMWRRITGRPVVPGSAAPSLGR